MCDTPNLAHVVSVVSKFMADLGRVHLETLKWVLGYLNGTISSGLMYRRSTHNGKSIDSLYCRLCRECSTPKS